MSKGDRSAIFALGLVCGVAVAALFFVWAFPWFSDPSQSAAYCQPDDQQCAQQYQNQSDPHFWVRPFYGWLFAEDSLAQWLMAAFAVFATGVSLWAVILIRDTLEASRDAVKVTREIGIAQTKAYVNFSQFNTRFQKDGDDRITAFKFVPSVKNNGMTPAGINKMHCHAVEIGIEFDGILNFSVQFTPMDDVHQELGSSNSFEFIPSIVDANSIERVHRGQIKLVIVGIVEYFDVFGGNEDIKYCTFCFRVMALKSPIGVRAVDFDEWVKDAFYFQAQPRYRIVPQG